MRRPFRMLDGPLWLGVNFWSRVGGPLMWGRYDAEVVAAELRVLRDHGLNVTRSFFYWPEFMPTADRIDPELLDRYERFLDAHSAIGLSTIPTVIVGHMSGQNWDPPWRGDRDLYADVWLVDRQAWFAEQLARRFADHPAVTGWLLTNEMPIYGGSDSSSAVVTAWARIVGNGLRAGGATQPISVGDGAWGIEVSANDNGFRLRELADVIDFAGPHVYPANSDQVRQNLHAAFNCELSAVAGKPVILEEFGVSSDFVSEENAGHYYRQVLHTSLLAGATGWIGWNNTDYDDLINQEPYSHHPFEMHFGVTDHTGKPKAALRELAEFSRILADVDLRRCRRADSQVALVVPSYFDTTYPFSDPRDAPAIGNSLRQSYIAAREAGIPPAITRESDGIAEGARLYLLPGAHQLTGPGWLRLQELAAAGATVYVSYSPGVHEGHRGPWYANLDALFGVRHQLRYGLVDPIEDDQLTMRLRAPLGGLPAGHELTFAVAGNANQRAYLPVEPAGATVLATDQHDRPALLRRSVGAGSMVLATYPLEAMAAQTPAVNPEDTWVLYDALADDAGINRPVRSGDPRVLVDVLERDDGATLVWLVSEAGEPVTVTIDDRPVTLDPFGVRVLTRES